MKTQSTVSLTTVTNDLIAVVTGLAAFGFAVAAHRFAACLAGHVARPTRL